MSKVDDELTRRLRGVQRPVEPGDVFPLLVRRKEQRTTFRRVRAGLLAMVAIGATAAGLVALSGMVGGGRTAGPSEPGGTIVFRRVQLQLSDDGGSSVMESGIWSIESDGSDLQLVSAPERGATTPAWSPDGRRIAVLEPSSEGSLERRLVTLWRDGSDRRLIADGLVSPLVGAVAWSPDGTSIAVLDTRGDAEGLAALDEFGLPRTDIAVYATDGAFERFVDVPGSVVGFRWVPDGSGFVVTRVGEPEAGTRDLVRVDLDGRIIGTVAEDVLYGASPAFSPDGSRIAYVRVDRSSADPEVGDVWVANGDGTNAARITEDGGRKPSLGWSPDGTRILYVRQTPEMCGIVSVASDGSDRIVVADRSAMGGCAQELSVQPGAPAPAPTSSPSPSSEVSRSPEGERRDIGLGVPMCDLEMLSGIDWDGTGIDGTAWTGAPVDEDGTCASATDVQHIVAIDRDGDGVAEQGATSTTACLLCRPFATVDLNGDGVLELVVLEEASSTPVYSVFEVDRPGSERAEGVYPLLVIPPGAPEMDLDPNRRVRFTVGGDEGFSGGIECEDGPDGPILRYTWVRGAVDADTDLRVDVTRLRFGEDGVFKVLSVDTFTVPRDPEPIDLISREPACGVDFHPDA